MKCRCGKVAYATPLDALRAAARIAGRHGHLYLHPCPQRARTWHLTRRHPRNGAWRTHGKGLA